MTRDEKTWYWCSDHVRDGDFDGLYVTHPESEHGKLEETRRKGERYLKKRKDARRHMKVLP